MNPFKNLIRQLHAEMNVYTWMSRDYATLADIHNDIHRFVQPASTEMLYTVDAVFKQCFRRWVSDQTTFQKVILLYNVFTDEVHAAAPLLRSHSPDLPPCGKRQIWDC